MKVFSYILLVNDWHIPTHMCTVTKVLALVLALLISAVEPQAVWASDDTIWPRQVLGNGADNVPFFHNESCAECHPQQFQEWIGSHHEQAMQPANNTTVLGNFNNASFTHFGITSQFFKQGDKFFVNTEGADGKFSDFEVKYTFGITPLQQYLLEFPKGRLQAFTIAWDTVNQHWFNLQSDEKIAHNDPLHWTQRYYTWNSSCAECHSTHLRLDYDLKTNNYKTAWAEINVSCQACHGPGSHHVKWANLLKKNKANPKQTNSVYKNKGLIVNYKTLDSKGKIETCARCHSRRYPISKQDKHSQPFLDDFMPRLLHSGLYHADGQILDEVFVYASFLQAKMYRQGVSCMDCHHPHTLKLRREGNSLCIFCHQINPPKKLFETLPSKNYNTQAHHFHPTNSTGALCVSCHMLVKNYMVIDPRHDHSFPIPRPNLSVKLGTPNACNQCHKDKSPQWAAQVMNKWYGPQSQQISHYAEIFAAGRARQTEAKTSLLKLVNDTNQAVVVRATALDLLRQYGTEEDTGAMIAALTDEAPLVRAMAVQGLENLPTQRKLDILVPLLSDPIRAVRIEAAKALAAVPLTQFDKKSQLVFEATLNEYKEAQMALADHPEGHFNLGKLYTVMGQPKLVEQSYKTAIKKDHRFFPAHNNLANFYYQTGRKKEAEKIFRRALESTTDQGMLYYSLGLLLAEQKRREEAVANLAKAAALMPNHPRVHYNYGLLLQHLGQIPKAKTALLRALQLSATDPSILHAVVIFYMQQHQWEQASTYAKQLVQLYPNAPEPRRMLNYLQKKKMSRDYKRNE